MSTHEKDDVQDDGGDKKVTFNETTEEKSYTKDKEIDEEGLTKEERRRKEKEFFTAELQRLKKSLKNESRKIKKPKERDYYPYVFTSLEPYYNIYTTQFLINMPDNGYREKQPPEAEMTMKEMEEHRDKHHGEEKDLMYTSRCTAIGLCDPWDSLHMDKSVLPKIETSEIRRKRMEKMHEPPKTPRSQSSAKKRPEAKLGSTRLPKFPVINLSNQDLATKELKYTDIPMLRDELVRSFSHQEGSRKQNDYTRTRQDFYRMELDRITEMHKNSRPHMRAAYFAYLQNTPGSRKAVYDCLRELNKKEEKPSPQAVA